MDPLDNWTDDNHLNKFIGLVETSVDLDQLENGEYMISSGYDSQLLALRNEQETLEDKINDLHIQVANALGLSHDKTLKLEKGTQYGHAFRITKKEEPKVRKSLNTQFIVLETRKDGVKFTNTKLKKLSDNYQKVVEEYKNCQKELVARVVRTAASFSEVYISTSPVSLLNKFFSGWSFLPLLLYSGYYIHSMKLPFHKATESWQTAHIKSCYLHVSGWVESY